MIPLRRGALLVSGLLITVAISLGVFFGVSQKAAPGSAVLTRELGQYRPVEAWLSVGERHISCEAVNVSADHVPWARCQSASGRIGGSLRRVALDEHNLHASGLAYLLVVQNPGGLERALKRLEAAQRGSPSDPARANDLAAALIERAGRRNQPADLVAALELLEQALLRSSPVRPWLLFNRALALEKLQLLILARQAWLRFLDSEPNLPWAAEARARLAIIEVRVQTQTEPISEHLTQAALNGDTSQLYRLAENYPREAREFAVGVGLPHWGESLLRGHGEEAARWLSAVQAVGQELAQQGGDRTALEAATTIEVMRNRTLGGERRLARAHQLYGEGYRRYRERDYPSASALFSEARPLLAAEGSPISDWAVLGLGSVELYNNQNEKAVAVLYPLLEGCSLERHPSLCGRTAWILGLALFRLGRLAESLRIFRASAAAFEPARESDSQAGALGLVAETLRELGDSRSAWQDRYRSLRLLGGQTRHRSIHNVLWEGGDAALEEEYPLVADLFIEEDVALFGEGPDPLLALESHLRRALLRRGRAPAALLLADLVHAESISRRLPSSPLLPRIEAEIQLASAELAAEAGAEKGETAFDRALSFFRRHRLVLREAAALLVRARTRRAQGRTPEAQADLQAAVQLFEEQRDQLATGGDRRLYSETWQGVYDELIALAAARTNGAMEALQLLERSRAAAGTARDQALPAPAPSTVILTYAMHSEALHRFQLAGSTLLLESLPVGRAEVTARIRHFNETLRFGRHTGPPATELTRLLVPDGLAAGTRFCFVPDREISGVPFAALPLPDGSGPLLSKHIVVVAFSIAGCSHILSDLSSLVADEHTVLLVGTPQFDGGEFPRLADLAGATDEAASLRKLYPKSTLLSGPQATAPALLRALPQASLLHFAGHAVAHPTDPSRSFLPLAPDAGWPRASLLSAADIARLHLPHLRLAVLSACDTFEPLPRRAEGISGLVRALLDAGASNVLGTLWRVKDRSSRELMIEFHRQLRSTGDPALALREAQLHALHHPDPNLRDPATWAAFELVVNSSD